MTGTPFVHKTDGGTMARFPSGSATDA